MLYVIPKLLLWVALTQAAAFSFPKLSVASLTTNPAPKEPSSNALHLLSQGVELYQAEKFSLAAEKLQQAVGEFDSQGNVLNEARALNYLSLVYQKLGQWSSANKAITDSLKLLQTTSNKDKSTEYWLVTAQGLNTQGQLQLTLGQSEKALNSWQQASAIYARSGDEAMAIGSHINQAQALKALGFYRRALTTLIDVEGKLQKQPDSPLKATGLRSLGDVLRLVGSFKESEEVLQQSLAVAKREPSSKDESAILISLGNTASVQQHNKEALAYYQEAAKKANLPAMKIKIHLNELRILLQLHQGTEIPALLTQINSEMSSLPISRATIYARINLAQSLICMKQQKLKPNERETLSPIFQQCPFSSEKKSENNSATSISELGSEIAQLLATAVQQARSIQDASSEAYALGYLGGLYQQSHQWDDALELTQKALILAETINAPDIAYRWQWQLGRLMKITGKNTEAIAYYSKAVNNIKLLRNDLVAVNPDVQFSFRDSVEPVYRELVSILLKPGDEEPSQKNIIQARDVIESLQLAELQNFFRQACLDTQPVQIEQVERTVAVIYPIILSDRLEVIVALPGHPLRHYATVLPQESLSSTFSKMRQSLRQTSFRQERLPLAQTLYDWLIRPAASEIEAAGVKTLVFVLDGELRNLPMAALHDGKKYIIEKYSIALTPGLQLLKPKPLKRDRLELLMGGISKAIRGFAPLPGVEQELDRIRTQVPSKVILNQEFTEKAIASLIDKVSFSIVHLATHGQFSSNAKDTFILLWDRRLDIQQLEDILQTRDLNQPHSPIELLVLSACQTAQGDNRAALGLAGIAVRSGARSTLASLWSVNDRSTASAMVEFYKDIALPGVNKAEALRRAQLSLLKQPQFSHPYYWAPFVLVGNWL